MNSNTEEKNTITLAQLIKKKLDKDEKRGATKEIYVESLNGYLIFNNPSDSMRLEYMEKTKDGSYVEMYEAMVRIIYDCCPTLRSKELQKEINIQYPYDTVKAIFETEEIMELGVKLINFFDEENEEEEEDSLKN